MLDDSAATGRSRISWPRFEALGHAVERGLEGETERTLFVHPRGSGSHDTLVDYRNRLCPNLLNFLKQANLILAWRATIAPEDRFWRTDEPKTAPKLSRRAEPKAPRGRSRLLSIETLRNFR